MLTAYTRLRTMLPTSYKGCLLYTSDAADDVYQV